MPVVETYDRRDIVLLAQHRRFVDAARSYVQTFDLGGYDAFLKEKAATGANARG